jgi:hypothetical protein
VRKGAGKRACLTNLLAQVGRLKSIGGNVETGYSFPSDRLDFTSKASRPGSYVLAHQPTRKPGTAGGRARYVEVGGRGGFTGGRALAAGGTAGGRRRDCGAVAVDVEQLGGGRRE